MLWVHREKATLLLAVCETDVRFTDAITHFVNAGAPACAGDYGAGIFGPFRLMSCRCAHDEIRNMDCI
jgi:hypothetical protein